jgi:hypothetical protein
MANFFHHDSPFTMISFHTCTIHMSPITSLLTFARFPSQSEPNSCPYTLLGFVLIISRTYIYGMVLIQLFKPGFDIRETFGDSGDERPCIVPPARNGITFLDRNFP